MLMNKSLANKGSASMAMVITAAAVSGVVALGVTRVMSMQFNAVASTDDKLRAQHDALNRAEILRASTFNSIVASSEELNDGFFEEVTVSEGSENSVPVKVAKIDIYRNKDKKELVASMVVKRTNPTISLVDEYRPEGAKDAAYNVSVVNKYFAHVDRDKNNGTVGSETKPVYVKDGTLVETDFSKAAKSDSDKIAVINPDGSFGYTTKEEFLRSNGISRTSLGIVEMSTGVVSYDKGARFDTTPYIGQILIIRPVATSWNKSITFRNTFSNFKIKLKDSNGNIGAAYSLRPAFGMNFEYLFKDAKNAVYSTNTYSPWVLIFDGNQWLVIGTFLNASGYSYSG